MIQWFDLWLPIVFSVSSKLTEQGDDMLLLGEKKKRQMALSRCRSAQPLD